MVRKKNPVAANMGFLIKPLLIRIYTRWCYSLGKITLFSTNIYQKLLLHYKLIKMPCLNHQYKLYIFKIILTKKITIDNLRANIA